MTVTTTAQHSRKFGPVPHRPSIATRLLARTTAIPMLALLPVRPTIALFPIHLPTQMAHSTAPCAALSLPVTNCLPALPLPLHPPGSPLPPPPPPTFHSMTLPFLTSSSTCLGVRYCVSGRYLAGSGVPTQPASDSSAARNAGSSKSGSGVILEAGLRAGDGRPGGR